MSSQAPAQGTAYAAAAISPFWRASLAASAGSDCLPSPPCCPAWLLQAELLEVESQGLLAQASQEKMKVDKQLEKKHKIEQVGGVLACCTLAGVLVAGTVDGAFPVPAVAAERCPTAAC